MIKSTCWDRRIVRAIMFGLALISLWGLPRPLGAAVVDKTGTISLDETWSTGNIYRITGDVTIVGGVKLTIQPGAIVKFNASTRIYVNTGAIKATGTSDNPIIFTSYRDDSAGGDTNGDGPSRGSPGDWNMVYFENPNGTFTDFRYCIFRYGGSGNSSAFNVYGDTQGLFTIADSVFSDNKSYGIYFYNAAHTIRNNTFERNTSHGIYLQSGTKSPLVEGNIIRNNSACGLYVEGMTPTIRNNQMLNNADWGLYFTSAVYPPVITGNTITGNLRPAIIPANALPNDSDGNTFAPNTINALWIRSNDLNHSVTLSIKHPGETYEINTYIFYDTLNINGTNKLTVNPGVIVKFADGASVSVNGTLNAIGTASQPIVFTSYRDDLHGGDINADGIATMPYNGAWAGLRFYDTSNDSDCKLSYAIVMYGGSSTANIYIENANPTIDHSTIAASLYDGINLYYSNPVITNSEIWGNFRHGINSYYGKPNVSTTMIYGNTYSGIYLEGLPSDYTIQNNEIFANQDYGINNKTTRICTATNTWWGATNGPSGVGSGSGDRISSNVTYAPIATSGSGFSYLNAGPNTKRGTLPLPTIIQGTSSSEWGSVVNTDVLWDLDKVVLRYAGLPTDKRYQLNLSYINGDNTTGVGGNIQSLWDGYGNFIHSRLKIPSTPGAFYYGLPPKSYNNSSAPGNLELNFVRENGYRATVAEVLIVEKGNIPNTIPPVSAITLPADNAHLRGSLYTMTGTCSDPNSDPIATVEIGIERAGSITWYAVTELKTSGNWKYRWGLPADGIYKLYSRATDIYGNREEPTSFVSVEVDNNPPEKPTNLAIYDYPADTGSKIQVTWRISADDSAADNDVVNYRIERRSNTTDDFSLIATVAAGVTSYEDSPTTDGTTYYYRIVAVDDAGNYGYSDIYGPVISIDNSSDSIAPKPITNLTGRAGNTFVTLGWTKSVDSDKDIYDQLLSVSDNGGTSWGSEISLGKETFYYLVSGLTNGVPYLFRIRTKDTAGNFSTWVQTGPHTPATTAYTAVSSDICPGGEVHWLAGVFWVRADIQICAGTTLYIHEGVIVKFGLNSGPYGRLTVRGALNAVGTAEKPIIFTSRFDDSAGGDTNGDGSTTTPAAGDWQNLYFESSNPLANCILNYVKIRYAGHDTYASGAIQTSYAAFPVTNSEIVNNKTDGINIYYSSMTIRNNLINNNKGHTNYGRGIYNSGTFTATISGNTISNHVHGIYLDGDARPTIINNTIQNNSSYGVYFSSNYTAPAMSGNIITGNNIALCVPLSALPREESGNSFSGNQKKYLQVRGNDLAATLELRIWHKGTADEIKTYWFVSSDAHVVTGAYLKIHPGVITKWASGIRLYVEGAMRAEGTSSEKIYFTSYRDDSVGGDTNGDGYTRGYPGDWYGLSFVDTVIDFLTLLDYSVVSYAGQSTAGIYTENTAFKITHSLITSNANHGIYQYYSNTLYQNNQILANNKNGIYTYGSGSPTIDGNIIAQNGESGIYVESNTYTTIRNNTINANAQWGIYFTSNPSVPVITGNTITNNLRSMILPAASMPNDSDGNTLAPNQINAIWLRGTDLYRNLELNIKYPSTSQEINTYVIYSTLTIRDSYTLTVRPGVIVKFDDNSGITVYGALNSQGTATQRIVYTSYRDDAYGGDLNLDGYGSGPYNGIWSGIRFYDSSIDNQCLFNYSILKYGGGSTALIYAENASPTFQNSVIAASSNDGINLYYSSIQLINCEIWGNTKSGIYTYYASPTVTGSRIFANYVDGILLEGNGSPTITNNEIFGNDGYGVRNNYTSKTINVTNIWWGAANGPSGVASGSGDQVSSALNYASYKTSGSNFVYFDAGPNRSEGTLPAMSVTSGIYSAEWGSTPGTNVLYDVDKVVLQATNLNPSTLYEIFLTYYNHDNTSGIGGNIQSLTDASNTIIHRSLSVPFSTPSPFFYSLPANTYGSGNLTLNFNRLNGYRACVSEVWVIEKGNVSDTTAPVVTITKPLNNAHINGSVYTVSGTATDGSGSGVMLVELGIDKGTGISWRAATELKNDGNWSYRWNLPSDGYYSLYVRGTDYVGNTGNPGTAVLVYINNTAPAVPTNVSAWDTPNDSGGSISLSWKKSTDDGAGIDDVVGYEIMRRQGTSGEFGLIGTVNKGAQAYVDATTTDQTDYYYQIVAVDKAGNRGTSTTYGPVKSIKNDGSDTTAPEDVTNLKGIPGNQFIFIYWTTSANSQKDLYDQLVSLSTDGGTSWGSDISIGKEATYYLIEGLLNNTAYKVRVRMKDSSGNISTGAQTGPHTPSTTAHTAVTADLCSGGDVHWLAGVYWIKADIQICSGTTLYIHEGVIVKFGLNSGPYGRLTVRGALNAVGTVEKPIIFTSRFDDSAGGDTNGDGSTTTPAAGDWQNLYFESSNPLSKCALDYVKIRYAGHDTYASGAIQTSYAAFPVTNSEIVNNKTDGINIYYSSMTISNNLISNNKGHTNYGRGIYNSGTFTATISGNTISNQVHGIYLDGDSRPTIINNMIQNNSGYGVYFSGNYAAPALSGNSITGNNIAVCIPISALPRDEVGNSFAGNQKKYIQLRGNDVPGTIELRVWHKGTSDEISLYWLVSSDIRVITGAFLKIHPKVKIKMGSGLRLSVEGALNAKGTVDEPIIFTSYRDDELVGDTNGDGFTRGAAGDWSQISFYSTVVTFLTQLDYVEVRYGGASSGGIYVEQTTFPISNCLIQDSRYDGINYYYSSAALTSNTIRNNGRSGIYLYGSSAPAISGNTIEGNIEGIYVEGGGTPNMKNNLIRNNRGWGIYYTSSSATPVIKNNTITGNTRPFIIPAAAFPNDSDGNVLAPNNINALWIRGNDVYRNLTFNIKYPTESYRIDTYVIFNTMQMTAGYRLTVDPAVTLKFADGAELTIRGSLRAEGTATEKVVFTSYADDSNGGDTNADGNGTTPRAGDWNSIRFYDPADDANCVIRHAIINYGGRSTAGIYAENTNVTLSDSLIANSQNAGINMYASNMAISNTTFYANAGYGGIYTYSSSPTFTGCRFFANFGDGLRIDSSSTPSITNSEIFANFGYGINNTSASTINASNNWWGSPTGPTISTNPGGTGDKITTKVTYSSFKSTGTEFFFYDAGASTHYGYLIGQPSMANGLASTQWGSAPQQSFLYNIDNQSIRLDFSGLSTAGPYTAYVLYMNQDSGSSWQTLTDASGNFLQRKMYIPYYPTAFEYPISSASLTGGYLSFNFNWLSGFRTVFSGVLLLKAGSQDTNIPNVVLTYPASGMTLPSLVHTITGKATDSSSAIATVEIGFRVNSGSWNWYTVSTLTDNGDFAYRWSNPGSGRYEISARAYDRAGNVGYAATTVNVIIDGNYPQPATDVYAEDRHNSDPGVLVMWVKSLDDGYGDNDVVKYEVYRYTEAVRNASLLGSTTKGVETFIDATAQNGTKYFYFIRTYDLAGNASDSSVYGPVTPVAGGTDTTAPENITGLTATPKWQCNGLSSVYLKWTDSINSEKDMADHRLYISSNGGASWTGPTSMGRFLTDYEVMNLTGGVTYTIKITVVDEVPNESSGTSVTVKPLGSPTEITRISGALTENARWRSGVYYIENDFTINAGVVLIIDPGVVVKFADSRYMYVRGALDARGSSTNHIIFTSIHEDICGDSNNNGSNTTPARGKWAGVSFYDSTLEEFSFIDYSEFRYGGGNGLVYLEQIAVPISNSKFSECNNYAINGYYAHTTISNNDVSTSNQSGIYFYASNPTITGNTVHDNVKSGIYLQSISSYATVLQNIVTKNAQQGILVEGGNGVNIKNNTITSNSDWGVYFSSGSDTHPTMTGNTITGNRVAVVAPIGALPDTSNTVTPNTVKLIGIRSGALSEHKTLPVFARDTSNEVNLYVLYDGTITVKEYKKLTIEKGIILKFVDGTGISVSGALIVNGTEDKPVFLTSYHDDFIGGDTNGNSYATSPMNGKWSGIRFYDSLLESFSYINYAVIRYGGSSSGNIYIEQADITVQNSTITNSSNDGINVYYARPTLTGNNIWGNTDSGIYLYGNACTSTINFNIISTNMLYGVDIDGSSNPVISNNQIFMNRSYGVYNHSTTINVNAQKNWWGDSDKSGPYQATTNPTGTGNAVSNKVDYSNYNMIIPLPFSYYDAAVSPRTYGSMPTPVVKQGISSDEWASSSKEPYYTMIYAEDPSEVIMSYTGLDPNQPYQLRVTYYNKDSGGGIQRMQAGHGTVGVDEVMFSDPLHGPFTMPTSSPTQYEWSVPTQYYADGTINLHFILFDPIKTYRALVEELWFMLKIEDFTPPRFTKVDFDDRDGSGTLSVGDEYLFTFSEEVKTSVIQNNSTDANVHMPPEGKSYGDVNQVRWSLGGSVCTVTVTSGFTIIGNELVDPSSSMVDLFNNEVVGTQNLIVTDSIAPLFTGIIYTDVDVDGTLSVGDQYTFIFNEAMKSSVIKDATNDANFHLRPAGGKTYGSTNTVSWNSDKSRCTVTLTSGFTVMGNELVTPSSSLTDVGGNQTKGTQYLSGNTNQAPLKPQNFSAIGQKLKIKATWSASSEVDLAGYLLAYGTSPGNYTTEINVGNVLTFTTADLPVATYYLSLRAYDLAGQRSPYADEVMVVLTGDITAPDPIINLTAVAGDRIVDLSWDASTDPDFLHYNIYVGIETYNDVTDMTPYATATSNSYQVTGLTNGVTYWFAVTAVDDSNNENPNVNVVSATPHGQITGAQAYWPFNEGSGGITADASGNGFNGTLRGRAGWSVEVPCVRGYCCVAQNHSIYFDGRESLQPPAVNVSPRTNCASSYSAANPIRVTLPAAGDYVVTSTGGAVTVWDDQHAWFYRLMITIQSTGQTVTMGRSDQYSSQAAAAAANLGISLSIHVNAPDSLLFWISDSVCTDNHGSLQAEVTGAPFVQNPSLVDGNLNIPISNTISLLAWFKASPTQFGQGSPNILAVESNKDSARTHGIFFDSDGSMRAWATCSGGGQTGVIDTGTTHYNDGQWHQVAYTFDGSTGRFYIDGQLRQNAAGSCSNMEDVQYFMVGRGFTGNVDDARIYNRILSADEISDNYKQCSGGPLAYWKFNEGIKDLITDVTGNNNNGTRLGSAAWVDSTIDTAFENYLPTDYALKLDGSDDLVTVGDKLDMIGGNFSVEVWVMKTSDSTASMQIVNKGMDSSGNPANSGYRLRYINNKLEFAVQGEYQGLLIQIPEPSINEWHQIVGVIWQNHAGKLYVDGDLKGSAVLDGLTGDMSTDLPLSFGAMNLGSSALDYLQGQIDEISIYDRALIDEEVMRHYWIFSWGVVGRWKFDEGSGTVAVDSSKQANHGTISAGSWTDSVLLDYGLSSGKALMLNGSSSMVEIPNSPTLRTYYVSLEAWVRAVVNSGQRMAILARNNEWFMQIGSDTGHGQNHFEVAIKPGYDLVDCGLVTPNVWTHLAAVWNGITLRCYINGQRVQEYNATRGWIEPTGNPIRIGNRWDTSAYFYGILDEVSVYNRPLGNREVDHRAKYGQMQSWPVAVITNPFTDGNYNANSDISFDGTPSYDPDGGALVYYFWSFGDKSSLDSASATATHRYSTPGVYPVNLAVGDNEGWSTGQTIMIEVK